MALAHRVFRDPHAQPMPALTLLHAIHFASSETTCDEGTVVCPGCSVGCRVSAVVEHNRVVRIMADQDALPSMGRICSRADALAADQSQSWNRVKFPMIRRHRGEAVSRVSWDQALTFVADEIQRVQITKGRDAIGWIGNGKLDTESAYLFNKLFKGFLGTNHTDGGAPAGLTLAANAMSKALGAPGSTACFNDVLSADVILILGCDLSLTHPVLAEMIGERRASAPNSRIVVLDANRTATAKLADVHVPLKPGSEAAFLQLVAKRLLAIGRIDDRFIRKSVEGFTDYRVALESKSEGELLAATGVHTGRVDEVVDFLQTEGRLLTLFNLDADPDKHDSPANPSHQSALAAALNLHLQLGEVGHEGAGLLALSARSNALGIAEAGATPSGLPGARNISDQRARDRLEVKWGVPASSIRPTQGHDARAMLEAAARGELALLWITGSLDDYGDEDLDLIRQAAQRCERIIVQDSMGDSDIAVLADVLLPTAAVLEKNATFTNAERLVLRSPKLIEPAGEAKPDWWIAARTAQLMGFDGFEYASEAAVWDEYRQLTKATLCDQSGITNERLDDRPIQWPCPDARHVGTARRFMSGRFMTHSGKAALIAPYPT